MIEKSILSGYSWFMIFRGILAILFATIAIFWPGLTLDILVLIFAFFVIIDGILAIISSIKSARKKHRWWVFLFEGLVGITAGIFILIYPNITAIALLFILAAWAIITGTIEFVAAIVIPWSRSIKWCLGSTGILSISIGVLMFAFPSTSIIVLIWFLGIYAFVFGLALLFFGVRGLSISRKIDS